MAAAYEAEMGAMIIEDRVWDRSCYLRSLHALPERPIVSFSNIR